MEQVKILTDFFDAEEAEENDIVPPNDMIRGMNLGEAEDEDNEAPPDDDEEDEDALMG